MFAHLAEGDSFPVPCRHCFRLSVVLVATAGTRVQRCSRCSGETRFIVESRAEGWEIHSQAVPGLPPPED